MTGSTSALPAAGALAPWAVLAAEAGGLPSEWIVGGALVFAGVLDVALAFALIGPRVPDERTRRIVVGSVCLGGAVMVAAGALFLTGVIPLGSG